MESKDSDGASAKWSKVLEVETRFLGLLLAGIFLLICAIRPGIPFAVSLAVNVFLALLPIARAAYSFKLGTPAWSNRNINSLCLKNFRYGTLWISRLTQALHLCLVIGFFTLHCLPDSIFTRDSPKWHYFMVGSLLYIANFIGHALATFASCVITTRILANLSSFAAESR
jgi:hypothetical protein